MCAATPSPQPVGRCPVCVAGPAARPRGCRAMAGLWLPPPWPPVSDVKSRVVSFGSGPALPRIPGELLKPDWVRHSGCPFDSTAVWPWGAQTSPRSGPRADSHSPAQAALPRLWYVALGVPARGANRSHGLQPATQPAFSLWAPASAPAPCWLRPPHGARLPDSTLCLLLSLPPSLSLRSETRRLPQADKPNTAPASRSMARHPPVQLPPAALALWAADTGTEPGGDGGYRGWWRWGGLTDAQQEGAG